MLGSRRRRKNWNEMTRSEIIATLIAFTVVGGVVVAGCICSLIFKPNGIELYYAGVIVFVLFGVAISWVQAIGELRQRHDGRTSRSDPK
jgi:hypothetical protein